jgi:hypothetical protein
MYPVFQKTGNYPIAEKVFLTKYKALRYINKQVQLWLANTESTRAKSKVTKMQYRNKYLIHYS